MNKPIWEPGNERIERANMNRFMRYVRESTGNEDIRRSAPLYDFSVRHPEKFWPLVWEFCGIRASGEFEPVLVDADKMPGARFFPNVKLNFAQNLLRHKDDRVALVFRNEWGHERELTYAELHAEVGRLAHALKAIGVGVGDRVAGFMPNIPETIIAMLAATSLGATWSSCSPDFGINGVVDRFGQIAPKVLFTADAYGYGGKRFDCLEKIRGVLEQIPGVEKLVVVPYSGDPLNLDGIPNAISLPDFAGTEDHALAFEMLPFDHPLYIMYSSGTTGVPKCIVHGAGGTLLQHLKEHRLHSDVKRGDRLFYFTTCGWMMWNWLVSGLASGATLLLYDGSPFVRAGRMLWDYADEERMTHFGTSAKYIDALKKVALVPRKDYVLATLTTMLSTGSPLAPESFDYVYQAVKDDLELASISGGTDIVSCFVLGNPTLPVWRGEIQCRGLGMAVDVFDEEGQQVPPGRGERGELVCVKPFPSMPIGFWNDPDGAKYRAAYFERFPGVWCHGDYTEITAHGGVIIHGRSDATLNPGGVRIGTAEIYRQVEQLDEVVESLVIGQDWPPGEVGDVRVVLFVKLRDGLELTPALVDRIQKHIRANTTPRHVPAKVVQVTDIPRTKSNKIVELAVRNVVHGRPVKNLEALANPEALDQFRDRAELRT